MIPATSRASISWMSCARCESAWSASRMHEENATSLGHRCINRSPDTFGLAGVHVQVACREQYGVDGTRFFPFHHKGNEDFDS